METTLNEHVTTHESVCQMRLQSETQDDFEASTDLQSDWIEKRLNTKLAVAKTSTETEQQVNLRACQIRFEQQDEQITARTTELAHSHASKIEQRLQDKLDEAMIEI
ncbi:hypothetical protein L914_03003 [Phytophthora nicotianae]|uniref:Uncharacterized protein n=2 Tax=Phytophthora nicotianae TaxID=4792 RepID=V9F2J4_PHYNI|nr:hypothetical protein F443_10392 [Phytophthora nicotianae P1569]ETM53524.1 hypothetical protein L914_03003 [Phytophthora nicotianae]